MSTRSTAGTRCTRTRKPVSTPPVASRREQALPSRGLRGGAGQRAGQLGRRLGLVAVGERDAVEDVARARSRSSP